MAQNTTNLPTKAEIYASITDFNDLSRAETYKDAQFMDLTYRLANMEHNIRTTGTGFNQRVAWFNVYRNGELIDREHKIFRETETGEFTRTGFAKI